MGTRILTVLVILAVTTITAEAAPSREILRKHAADAALVARGRYLVKIGGCNDCHTAHYSERNGAIPESDWLLGDRVGWHGEWGTTYAINLRLFINQIDEDGWVKLQRTSKARPPMPWYEMRDLQEQDLRAIYRFIKYLGPKGEQVPEYVPPGKEPSTPYFTFEPVLPKK